MGIMTEKPVKIVELLEDKLGKLLKNIVYIFKVDHRYMIHLREELIASFKIKQLPGQCGIAMLYNLNVVKKHSKKGIGRELLKNAIKICNEQDYTSVMVTILKEDEHVIRLFTENGFELLYQFRNKRTKNAIVVLQKDLTEVEKNS
jgi:ribosomal protein S18 acetylase RimI-like enzyme